MSKLITSRPWLVLLLVCVLAAGVRLAWIGVRYTDDLSRFESGDYELYWHGGRHIQEHGDLTNSLFAHRPPLFPLLIALVGIDNDLGVLLVNALIGAALAPLSVILARQLGLRDVLATWVGVIVALDPASVVYAAWLGAEPLANVWFMLMVIALLHAVTRPERGRAALWGGAAGAALALSVLARPTPFLIWTGLAVWLLVVYRPQWATVAAYVLVSVIGVGAWVIHNGQTFDNYTVSTVGSYSLLYYRAASVEHWGSGDDMSTVYARLARRVEERLGHDTTGVDADTRHTHYSGPSELTDAMNRTALETFTRYPQWYVAITPIGLARMFGWTNPLPRWTRPLEVAWNTILVSGTAAGLWLAYRQKRWLLFWGVFLVCGYFTGATIFSQTSGLDTRMRTMLAPFMAMALVLALDTLRARWRTESARAEAEHAPLGE
jgi:hypothetical protein